MRIKLIKKGYTRSKHFSWKNSAEMIWKWRRAIGNAENAMAGKPAACAIYNGIGHVIADMSLVSLQEWPFSAISTSAWGVVCAMDDL